MSSFESGSFNEEAVRWHISTFSSGGSCVAVGRADEDTFAVRNSNHPADGMVTFNRQEWEAFVLGVKAGEFDSLAP